MNRIRSAGEAQALERLGSSTSLAAKATRDISAAFTRLLTDAFALCAATKNLHWHMRGPRFRDYHFRREEHGGQIFSTTDPVPERARKAAGTTLWSIGQISRQQRTADYATPPNMLAECWPNREKIDLLVGGSEQGADGEPHLRREGDALRHGDHPGASLQAAR